MSIFNLVQDSTDDRDYKYNILLNAFVLFPEQIDLRELCPPVYNQGEQGSCTAQVGCAAKTILLEKPELLLSRAFLYYQTRLLEGGINEDSGATMRNLCKAAKEFGVCEEMYMPYNEEDYRCEPTKDAVENATKYKVQSYSRLLSLDEIKQSLATNKTPVMMGMNVYESMKSDGVAKDGILPMPKRGESLLGGHAVLVVGYVEPLEVEIKCFLKIFRIKKIIKQGYLIVRNSWGEEWGDKGYFYMSYDYFKKYTFDYWIFN